MGGMQLSIAYRLWPRWLSKHKDIGESKKKKKAKVEKKLGGTPSTVLARSLSLRRANARAKAYRFENSVGHNYDQNVCQHRFSQSIEALYILSKIKEDVGLGDRPGYAGGSMEDDLWDGEDDVKDLQARRMEVHGLSASLPLDISGSVKDSVALVKYSYNPYEDFRDSMMQMIRANNLLDAPSGLEELLYCYFTLNSPGHYDCIRDAFRDICRELEVSAISFRPFNCCAMFNCGRSEQCLRLFMTRRPLQWKVEERNHDIIRRQSSPQ